MSKFFYTLIGFACVNIMSSCFLVFTYLTWKAGRKSPGDVVFGLAISQLITSAYWMMSIPDVNTPSNSNALLESNYCRWVDLMQNIGFCSQFVYNLLYCFTMRQEITNVLKTKTKTKLLMHSICIIFTFFISLLLFSYQPMLQHQAKYFDKCTSTIILDSHYLPLALYILQILYIISALYTIWYFYQNLPADDYISSNKRASLLRYIVYIISTIIQSLFVLLGTFIQTSTYQSQAEKQLNAVVLISTCSVYTLESILLCYQRIKNPALFRKIINMFHRAFFLQRETKGQVECIDVQLTEIQKIVRTFQINSILNGIKEFYEHLEDYVDEIYEETAQFNVQNEYEPSLNTSLLRQTFSDEQIAIAQTLEKYKLNNQSLNKEFSFFVGGNEKGESKIQKTPKIYALAPKYFYYLLRFDGIRVEAEDSFSIEKNAELIENIVNVDGGKSGEFFFFSYDNKWILKTIIEPELMSFRQRMPEYFHHLCQNRDSLISKIYGVFSYDMNYSSGGIYHMVLQRNISQVPRQYIKRTFDLKGSEVAREALKGKPKDQNLSKITLKDVDFDNLEKVIRMDETTLQKVKTQLIKDVELFKSTYLLDYSLLIMIVDWSELQFNINSLPKNVYQSLDSQTTFYHIAIIDYLQEWNFQKMAEKAYKQILAMNPHLNVSAQTPEIYAFRFINNLVEKIFV